MGIAWLIRTLSIATLASGCAFPENGQSKLRVRAWQATRFYLDDGNGRAWVPDGAIAYARRDEKHFIVKNGFEIRSRR